MVALIALAHGTSQDSTATYNIVWVLIGVATLVGFGIGAVRWIRNQGKADAERTSAEAEVRRRLDVQDSALARLETAIKPNGLDSQELGDIAKRTENKVDALVLKLDATVTKLDKHIGAAEIEEREIWREIHKKADK
jgi:hypothetical protein